MCSRCLFEAQPKSQTVMKILAVPHFVLERNTIEQPGDLFADSLKENHKSSMLTVVGASPYHCSLW